MLFEDCNNLISLNFSLEANELFYKKYKLKKNLDLSFVNIIRLMSTNDIKRFYFITLNFLSNLGKFKIAFKANTIHSIDAHLASQLINSTNKSLITNHDCFFVTPNNILNSINEYNKRANDLELKINKKIFKYDIKFLNN